MSKVFVLDSNKRPLDSCHSGQARRLLKANLAAVHKLYPFTIILKEAIDEKDETKNTSNYILKIDPGSKKTGLAIVNQDTGEVVFAAEIEHRGNQITKALLSRKEVRRSRRSRKTRYRKPRFNNRRKTKRWIAPSLESRIFNIETWVRRLLKLCPIKSIAQELVRFDMQLLENANIDNLEYQRGELFGFELKEYLLYKNNHKCAYCGKKDQILQIEHIIPKSRLGSNKISNLTIACVSCNTKKGNKTGLEFGYPNIGINNKTYRDASVVNITRWILNEKLKNFGLDLEVGSGALTKFNRVKRNLPKDHWIDAACVGLSTPDQLNIKNVKVLHIKATGHGSRQMVLVDKYGFPRSKAKGKKKAFGFQTGDMVKAIVTKGKKMGIYKGKVSIRSNGNFNITSGKSTTQGINHKFCKLLFACDGYSYSFIKGEGDSSPD